MAMIISSRQGRFGLRDTLKYYLYGPHYLPLPEDLGRPTTRLVKILHGAADEPIRCELYRAVLWPGQGFESDANVQSAFAERYDTVAYTRYKALSYVWGDTENKVPISVNGQGLMVTQNLYLALGRLREESAEEEWESVYWIDAICIN
jgi:hypothetical protein